MNPWTRVRNLWWNSVWSKFEGGGDGSPNTSRVLLECKHAPRHQYIYRDGTRNPSPRAGKELHCWNQSFPAVDQWMTIVWCVWEAAWEGFILVAEVVVHPPFAFNVGFHGVLVSVGKMYYFPVWSWYTWEGFICITLAVGAHDPWLAGMTDYGPGWYTRGQGGTRGSRGAPEGARGVQATPGAKMSDKTVK